MTRLSSVAAPLVFFLSVALYSQQADFEKEDIRIHKIKRITMVIYYYSPGNAQSFTQSKFTSDYDSRGNLIKRIGYSDQTGLPSLQWSYVYDNKNNMIESAWDTGKRTASYEYDNAGRLVASKTFDGNGNLQGSGAFVLNSQGKVIAHKLYNASGQITETHNSKYDSLGNLVEYSETKADGTLISKKANTFNSAGDATQTLVYGSDGRISGKTIYKYGDGRHLMEQTDYAADGTVKTRHTLKRDAKGFVVEDVESDSNGQTVTVTKSDYEFYP